MTNSIRTNAPKAKTFRSLDYYLLICMMFVFGALAEFAVVGMTDPKNAMKWKREMRWKKEIKEVKKKKKEEQRGSKDFLVTIEVRNMIINI